LAHDSLQLASKKFLRALEDMYDAADPGSIRLLDEVLDDFKPVERGLGRMEKSADRFVMGRW
jgi:hypothetical protein